MLNKLDGINHQITYKRNAEAFKSRILILSDSKVSMYSIASVMKKYPQVLINVKVREEAKGQYENDQQVTDAINEVEKELDGEGRVLIRPSGTEALIRVMIEGLDQDDINKKAKKIADVIKKRFGI